MVLYIKIFVNLATQATIASSLAMQDAKNLMCEADAHPGGYLISSAMFRGKKTTKQVDAHMINGQNKNSLYFIEWIPLIEITNSAFEPLPILDVKTMANAIKTNWIIQFEDIKHHS